MRTRQKLVATFEKFLSGCAVPKRVVFFFLCHIQCSARGQANAAADTATLKVTQAHKLFGITQGEREIDAEAVWNHLISEEVAEGFTSRARKSIDTKTKPPIVAAVTPRPS